MLHSLWLYSYGVHLAVWLSDHLDTKLCTGIKKFDAATASLSLSAFLMVILDHYGMALLYLRTVRLGMMAYYSVCTNIGLVLKVQLLYLSNKIFFIFVISGQ